MRKVEEELEEEVEDVEEFEKFGVVIELPVELEKLEITIIC